MTTPKFITEDQIREVLRLEQLIPAMEKALVDFSAGRVRQPVRSVIPVPEHNGVLGIMPAVYGDVMGAKLVTVYPGNGRLGLPTHLAMLLIFSASTGEPLAAMDARLITELRTAAVTAVATNLLAPAGARSLAILGSGVQARSHLEALRLVRPFDDVHVWSRTAANAQRFAGEMNATAAPSVEAAVRDADVVVTVTAASEPVLRGAWLKPGALVNAVGAVGPKRRELDEEAMQAGIVVESRESALRESGDILLAGASVYAELGELLAGKAKPTGRVVYKSLGIAVEDITSAALVLQLVVDPALPTAHRSSPAAPARKPV
jgi:thiomorpholine-carboxylate dehydrogenase